MRHMRLLIPVFLLAAILSGCAAEREESLLPRTETEPVNLDELKTRTVPEAAKESAKEPADVPPVTMPRPD